VVLDWLRHHLPATRLGQEPPPLAIEHGATRPHGGSTLATSSAALPTRGTQAALGRPGDRLVLRLHRQTGDGDEKGAESGDWMIIMREVSDTAVIEAMSFALKLTAREAEVLYWVVKGKTNKDIGEILGSSPATAKKHLERVYVKLGVETRTAAAGVAIKRIRELQPQFEI
jgi:DNA-binding CsgD family transcriptional regulator